MSAGVTACLLLVLLGAGTALRAETLAHGRFKHVEIFRPSGEVKHFALFLSGDGGWNSKLALISNALAADGTLVAGVDTAELFADLEKDGGSCVSPDGDLENLSHYVQAYYKVPTYFRPILLGHSAGATLAYASLAQAPAGVFAGALTLSFCVDLDLHKPLCQAQGLRFTARGDGPGARLLPPPQLHAPWFALHGAEDKVCPAAEAREFVARIPGARFIELPRVSHNYAGTRDWLPQLKAALAELVTAQVQEHLPAPPATLADLPIVEVEAAPGTAASDSFAVLISGDGGWAGIDKEVAGLLSDRGVPTAGVDSLRYFWTARTPQGLAQDIDRVVRYYAFHWKKKHALLVGYSQGADVLPFVVNRLPPATRALVRLTTLIGVSGTAAFEFHVSNWIGSGDEGLPVRPEIEKLSSVDTLCVYGDDDAETICPKVSPQHARVIELPGGHHFGGNYLPLAQLILGANARPPAQR
ncbi:MAG TPA: AcvB/VirJ family lysyl-phosphatidylglycerol hydrolase [Steroidobacteraceae bacterium]|nr:AcvB/VirJ family lysyl-phosphatidylglycerol hydrolase [Steroidobacteraceae bacterium]